MNIPQDLLYTEQHEWVRVEGAVATMGITDYAQDALGDITFIDLPKVGKALAKGAEAAAIESCKAAASVYAAVAGKVTAVNAKLASDPGALNRDPYGDGWILKLAVDDPAELKALLDPAKYAALIEKEH